MTGKPWRWAWISITGLRFLGIYGRDEYGFVFHAVVDLAATPEDQISNAARDASYQAQAMWRLGAHEEVAKSQPKAACVLALVGFWGLQIGLAAWVGDFTALFTQGILIKILFTAALIRGLKSANRATMLKSELEQVFG